MKISRFSAIWCMNCIYMKSVWEEIERDFPGLDIKEFDADDHSDVHKEHNIKDIPTVIFFDDSGNEILRLEGAKDKEDIVGAINTFLK